MRNKLASVKFLIAGAGAKGVSMFIGSMEVKDPSHSYRIGTLGGGASLASLIITEWIDVDVPLLKKKGALNNWYVTVNIESAVVGIKDTKVKVELSTKSKHLDVVTPVRVECTGVALDGIKLDGKLLLNEQREDPRFDPRSLFSSNASSKSLILRSGGSIA